MYLCIIYCGKKVFILLWTKVEQWPDYPLFLTGALQEILYLNPPPYLGNPPPYSGNRPGVAKNALPGPKKVTDMTPKKKPCSEIYRPPLFCKKTGPIWYSLASAASFLIYPSVYGVTTLCYISIPR